ncbi:hypothetical protein [Paludibaculum fermentans]|uniref:hypothetical protein n=1 Tax=Paludibaculum fermentans TaxID=1473598 RepID=UPI003EBA91D4
MRFVLLLIAAASVAEAQFSILATDASASHVRFTGGTLRNDPSGPQAGLYEWSAGVAGLVPAATGPAGYGGFLRPALSDGGEVMAWTLENPNWWLSNPIGGPGYAWTAHYYGMVENRNGQRWGRAGKVELSRNGRWAWFAAEAKNIPGAAEGLVPAAAVDLWTGQEFPASGILPFSVADDGTAIVTTGSGSIALLKPGGSPEYLPLSIAYSNQISMDRYARLATSFSTDLTHKLPVLTLLDVATKTRQVLAESCDTCGEPSISGEGTRVLITAKSINGIENPGGRVGAWIYDIETATWRRISDPEEEVLAAALSADGSKAVLASDRARILSIDLSTQDSIELVPDTPFMQGVDGSLVPGSKVTITGYGLKDAALTVSGRPVAPLVNENKRVEFVVPEDAPEGPGELVADQPESPFAAVTFRMEVKRNDPTFIVLRNLGFTLWYQALKPFVENGTRGGLVAEGNPAFAGEELWIWMRGISAPDEVQIQMATGFQGPYEPVQPLVIDRVMEWPGWQRVRMRAPALAGTDRFYLHVAGADNIDSLRNIQVYVAPAPTGGAN